MTNMAFLTVSPPSSIAIVLVLVSFLFPCVITTVRLDASQRDVVARFLADNGRRNVTLVDADGDGATALAALTARLSRGGVLSAADTAGQFGRGFDKMRSPAQNFVILSESWQRFASSPLLRATATTAPGTVLVVTRGDAGVILEEPMDLEFFLHVMLFPRSGDGDFQVFQVFNTPRFFLPVVNKVDFRSDKDGDGDGEEALVMEEEYDLGGRHILGVSLAFPPYLYLEGCSEDAITNNSFPFPVLGNVACTSSRGYFVDIMRALGEQHNFSSEVRLPADGLWGLEPRGGDFERAIFDGVVGLVVNGTADFSPSTWIWNSDRDKVFDAAPALLASMVLALKPQSPKVDLDFFFRPFTDASWLCTLLITLLILAIVVPPYIFLPNYEYHESHQIASTTGWIFFTLLNAYYGGALTMFFTSEVALPFDNVREVITSSWTLKFLSGNSEFFSSQARNGDQVYKEYYSKYLSAPGEYTFPNILSGLDDLCSGPVVIQINEGILTSAFALNASLLADRRVETFGNPDRFWSSIILPKRSPLTRMFTRGLSRMRQAGVMGRLSVEWEGPGLPKATAQPLEVLSLGQTIMVYLLMGMTLTASAVLFVAELITRYVKGSKGDGIARMQHGGMYAFTGTNRTASSTYYHR